MNSEIIINSVEEFINKNIEFPNFKYARGESKKYETPFLPNIFRGDPELTPYSDESCYTKEEYKILQDFQKKVITREFFDPYFEVFIKDVEADISLTSPSLWHWTALAQHYGEKTRLVDVTADLLAALYFASESHDDKSGYVYIFKAGFNEIDRDTIKNVKFGKSFFDIDSIGDIPSDNHPRIPNEDTMTVIKPFFPNLRIEAQKGCFCFTKGINAPACSGGWLEFEIQNKNQIREELNKLGYNKNTIYPNQGAE